MSSMTDYNLIIDAMKAGDIDRLKEYSKLIDNFPDGVDQFIGDRWVIGAIDNGTVGVIRWMLDQKVSLNFPDHNGYPPLHSCIESGRADRLEIIGMLVDAGANLDTLGMNGWTALHLAACRDEFDVIRQLIDAGADKSVRANCDDYNTAEQEARMLGHTISANLIRDYVANT